MLSTLLLIAATGIRPFHLTLEANPTAPFPFLSKFGSITLHVYPKGVRAESLWLRGFSVNGSKSVTVEDPLNRTYSDVSVSELVDILHKFSGPLPQLETAAPSSIEVTTGNVRGIAARRYRLLFAPNTYIDIWTTTALGEAPQYVALVREFVTGISPATAAVMKRVPGVPLYVELNFRRFKKLPLLRVKAVAYDNKGEDDALKVSSFMFRAPNVIK